MCLAILVPIGSKLPERKHLSNGWTNNPNGAGIAWWAAGEKQVHIIKGMMTKKDFFQELARLGNCKDKLMLIHFRQATAGRICPENCHPFPVSADPKYLQATRVAAPIAVVHNGIIVNYDSNDDPQWYRGAKVGYYSFGGSLKDELLDTQKFIKDYMAPLGEKIWDATVQKLLLNYTDSKLAWISNMGQFAMLGKFEYHKGSWYSNTSYSYKPTWKYTKANTKTEDKPFALFPRNSSISGMQRCEMCGEWADDKYITEFEELMLCKDCLRYVKQGIE